MKTLLRTAASALLLAALLYFTGVGEILEAARAFNAWLLVPLVLLVLATAFLSGLAVYALVRPIKKIPAGMFFGNYVKSWATGFLLPGKIGDFSLAYFLRKELPPGKTSAVVLLDKLVSFAFLAFLSILLFAQFGLPHALEITAFLLAVFGLAVFAAFSGPGRALLKKTVFAKNKELFAGFGSTLRECLAERKKHLFANFLVTVLRSAVMGFSLLLLASGFGYSVGLLDMVLVNAAIVVIALVPVTLSGLGLREGSFVFFSALYGLPRAVAASAILISTALDYAVVFSVFLLFLPGEINEIARGFREGMK